MTALDEPFAKTMTRVTRSQTVVMLENASALKAGDVISVGEEPMPVRYPGGRMIAVARDPSKAREHPPGTPVKLLSATSHSVTMNER